MQRDDARESLYETLVVYLLDAESNVAATAALLFVHKNTIKYRVHQMSAALHFDVNSMPEHHSLYCAVAIKRLLENQFDTALKATST
jgi:DNA-binding PucR family transcriptional regulator